MSRSLIRSPDCTTILWTLNRDKIQMKIILQLMNDNKSLIESHRLTCEDKIASLRKFAAQYVKDDNPGTFLDVEFNDPKIVPSGDNDVNISALTKEIQKVTPEKCLVM